MKTAPILFAALAVFSAAGQQKQDLRFDVTSIKPSNPDYRLRHVEFGCMGGRFVSTGMSAMRGILWAWGIPTSDFFFRVADFPEWGKGVDAFVDIEAKASIPVSEDDCRVMVRSLFADRYKLQVHWEEREISAFAMVIAPKGPKIKRVPESEETVNGPGFTINGSPIQMHDPKLKGWSMDQLAFALQVANLGRPVFDKTGLEGIYKIALSFRQRETEGEGPDVTTAIEEQLGLRLEPGKERVKVLVIDRMSKPDPN